MNYFDKGSSKATSRAGNYQPIPFLTATQQPGTNKINLNWRWAGTRDGVTFEVNKEVTTTAQKSNIYSGSGINKETEMQGSIGDQHCFTVTAKVGQITSPESNKVCFTQISSPAS